MTSMIDPGLFTIPNLGDLVEYSFFLDFYILRMLPLYHCAIAQTLLSCRLKRTNIAEGPGSICL